MLKTQINRKSKNRKEYQRQYRKNNPERVKQWNLNFYLKRAKEYGGSSKSDK